MDDKEDSSNAWLCGMAVVIVGVVGILSIAAFSAGYYGETDRRMVRHWDREIDREIGR